jgi:hypothetical protein
MKAFEFISGMRVALRRRGGKGKQTKDLTLKCLVQEVLDDK